MNKFIKAVIDCIDLFAGEVGSLEHKDLAQLSNDIAVFAAAYEKHVDAIIDKLLDERRFLFFNLHQAFVAPFSNLPRQFRKTIRKGGTKNHAKKNAQHKVADA